ncbi:MAG: CBS domain-containing protein [Candidatus Bathyarchaeia archaeon]
MTERDLLERVLEKCRNPKETKVSEIMTKHVITGKPDMGLIEATEVMFKNKVKKLPIIKENQLVGIVTLTDIARATSTDKQTIELIQKLSNMHII